jgi:hypothetical protein
LVAGKIKAQRRKIKIREPEPPKRRIKGFNPHDE